MRTEESHGGEGGTSGRRSACLGVAKPGQCEAGGARAVGGQEEDGGRQVAPENQCQGPEQVGSRARNLGGETADGGRQDPVTAYQGVPRVHGVPPVRPVQCRDVGAVSPQLGSTKPPGAGNQAAGAPSPPPTLSTATFSGP